MHAVYLLQKCVNVKIYNKMTSKQKSNKNIHELSIIIPLEEPHCEDSSDSQKV